jgi:hypothetical protein
MLLVAERSEPVDSLAVELLDNSNMSHGRGCDNAKPMFQTGRNMVWKPPSSEIIRCCLSPRVEWSSDRGL